MSQQANWNYPTQMRFGAGRISELADVCREAGIVRPLFVTDGGLSVLPMTEAAVEVCRSAGLGISLFSNVRPNPTASNVEAGVRAYHAGGHDGVVAFGGGSALDAGKCIAFMQGQTRPIWDFEDVDDWWMRADVDRIAPVIAVPTTAGTGSEVGRAGVITDANRRVKKIIFHPKMMPVTVISDPELTVGLPPALTAGVGMDALAHCLEAYCAPSFHPMSNGVALEGARLVSEALPRAFENGADLEARSLMLVAASMGAVAFQKGLGAIHALSHPVGALYDTHHGMTNAVFMPYVLAFNREAIQAPMDKFSAYLGLKGGFDGFLDWVLDLRSRLGVPHTLAGLGVDDAQIELISAMAVQDPSAGGNPVKLTVSGARAIFEAAHRGTV
jgi:alcohol dehydrogenase